jgi:hypothetical protein
MKKLARVTVITVIILITIFFCTAAYQVIRDGIVNGSNIL